MNKKAIINWFNEDSYEAIKNMPDNAYELAIVDPPYQIGNSAVTGAGKLRNRTLNQSARKLKEWDIAPSDEYFKELKRVSKNQIIWGGNYFNLPPTRGVIAWDKMQPWDNFSQWEMAWTSFSTPAKLYKYDNRTGDKIHPTQKPVSLYKWLLDTYAKDGDKILDTHGGSGSIAIACHDMGFDLDIYEIDKDYFDAAKKRFDTHALQQRLFY